MPSSSSPPAAGRVITMTGRICRLIHEIVSVAAAVLLAVSLASAWPAAAAKKRPPGVKSFFNTFETKKGNLKPFPKWTKVLERCAKARESDDGPCAKSQFNIRHYNEWKEIVNGLRSFAPIDQLKQLNAALNKKRYIVDMVNWGVKDYWETPGEFFNKFGDCEDYAIAKYMSLRALGYTTDQIRVVVVKDLNLRVGHAILAVFLDGKTLILDNQIRIVVEAKKIRHYKVIYSVNEVAWWRHNRARK